MMDLITLRAGDARLQLAPGAGGAIVRYWWERSGAVHEWLRPATRDWLDGRDPYQASAFPLVPYSNRIREGRFVFDGREVTLPRNRPPERHSIHGHGWQGTWTPLEVSSSTARLEYRHAAGAWPWAYRAEQRLALASTSLTVELGVCNDSATAMPAGLGWHPYFPRTPRTTLTAAVRAMWLTDDEMLPARLETPAPERDPSRGLAADEVVLDNGFTGWCGRAVIDWPELGTRVVMTAGPPLDVLTVYTPPRRPFLCVEPVSHVTDAINLVVAGRADTGLRVLEPGETLSAAVTLTPEIDARPRA
jgi:aldose 1-epimerase